VDTLTLEELKKLNSNDATAMVGIKATVEESGTILHEYYLDHPRYNYRGGVKGKFWDKVGECADILRTAEEWPFPPLEVVGGTLVDGHHRANAALMVEWDKEIPVSTDYCDDAEYDPDDYDEDEDDDSGW